ncbi:hypothetical protein ACIGO8_08235 [Streptomyces sp. NPDC053493]|uniref:hypothetical protein n=1 Tax=Streptomyces sp. NPDC053493 TaxID=3365705 RepID=UPI0037D1B3DC
MTDQPPLWHDGWEQEADRKAGIQSDEPIAGYARPCSKRHFPSRRPIHDVLETL